MTADELYKAGQLGDAIQAQIDEVKADPTDQAKRLFLFELLLFAGELDRARRQIDAVDYKDTELNAAVGVYRKLLDAEQARRDLFSRSLAPGFFGEPSEHLKLRLEAVNRLKENRASEAAEILGRANEATPNVRGRINGVNFESFRDADDLFTGVLEVMAHGRYFWVGFEQVRLLTIDPPRFPRDLIFPRGRLELQEEEGDIFIPSLYPASYAHSDDRVRMGRMTDWKEISDGVVVGIGLHTYVHGDDAIGLLELREWRSDQH
jgi:type VI secretion system protein ImpE